MPPRPKNRDRPIRAPLLELDKRHRDTDVSLLLSGAPAATSIAAGQTVEERRARTRQRAWSTEEGAAQGEGSIKGPRGPKSALEGTRVPAPLLIKPSGVRLPRALTHSLPAARTFWSWRELGAGRLREPHTEKR